MLVFLRPHTVYTVTWFLSKSKFTNHTIKPPLLECVQSNTILWNDLNQVQFTQLNLTGSKIKDRSNAELNQIQSMDWVWLYSIKFEFLTFDWDIAQDVFSSVRNPKAGKSCLSLFCTEKNNNSAHALHSMNRTLKTSGVFKWVIISTMSRPFCFETDIYTINHVIPQLVSLYMNRVTLSLVSGLKKSATRLSRARRFSVGQVTFQSHLPAGQGIKLSAN